MSEDKKNQKYYYGCGKRKTAIAKVHLFPKGSGKITINEKDYIEYCKTKTGPGVIQAPLKLTDSLNKFDIVIQVTGGGTSCQTEAIRHGISRALVTYNQELRPVLKRMKFLTRDSRVKERKKYGLKRARRAPQFSK
ncbi:30S ribosomal protein S9, partial [Candidatus Peregrinibacteria bacterium RIFOXYC2_FULL_33_13]